MSSSHVKNRVFKKWNMNIIPIKSHCNSYTKSVVGICWWRFDEDNFYNIGTNDLGMTYFQYYQDAFLYYIANTCLGEIETQLLFLFSFLISNKKRIYQIELSKKIVTQGNFSVNMQHITINAYPLPILQNNFLSFK